MPPPTDSQHVAGVVHSIDQRGLGYKTQPSTMAWALPTLGAVAGHPPQLGAPNRSDRATGLSAPHSASRRRAPIISRLRQRTPTSPFGAVAVASQATQSGTNWVLQLNDGPGDHICCDYDDDAQAPSSDEGATHRAQMRSRPCRHSGITHDSDEPVLRMTRLASSRGVTRDPDVGTRPVERRVGTSGPPTASTDHQHSRAGTFGRIPHIPAGVGRW
jgi:hypothetical protein